MTCMKPVDWRTIQSSLEHAQVDNLGRKYANRWRRRDVIRHRFRKLVRRVGQRPVMRLCMEDAPVPYAGEMEKEVVKRASDLVEAAKFMCGA